MLRRVTIWKNGSILCEISFIEQNENEWNLLSNVKKCFPLQNIKFWQWTLKNYGCYWKKLQNDLNSAWKKKLMLFANSFSWGLKKLKKKRISFLSISKINSTLKKLSRKTLKQFCHELAKTFWALYTSSASAENWSSTNMIYSIHQKSLYWNS